MPVFGGPVKAKIEDNIVEFNRYYLHLYLDRTLPVDVIACTKYMGSWRCGSEVLPKGTEWGRYTLSTDLEFGEYYQVSSDYIEYLGEYDLVNSSISLESGYVYVVVWDRLRYDQFASIICGSIVVMTTQGPVAFYAVRDPIGRGGDNDERCNTLTADVGWWYSSTQKARVVKISLDPSDVVETAWAGLFMDPVTPLFGTFRKVYTWRADISAISL